MLLKKLIFPAIFLAGTFYSAYSSLDNFYKLGQSSGDIRTAEYINMTSPTKESLACVPCLHELRDTNENNLLNSLVLSGFFASGLTGFLLSTRKRSNVKYEISSQSKDSNQLEISSRQYKVPVNL